jgi:hypothetical protein
MDTNPDTQETGPSTPATGRWALGHIFLVVCLVSGCWGVVANHGWAMKPVAGEDLGNFYAFGQWISSAVIILGAVVFLLGTRYRRPRRYVLVAGFQLGQFLLAQMIEGMILGPSIRRGVDYRYVPLPASVFWTAFGLSIVEMAVAILALGLPLPSPVSPARPEPQV